jgi:cell division topological specificity factor
MRILDRLLGSTPSPRSSAVAKQRLTFVLEFDRAHLSPGVLELIKDDIIQAISRHVQVETDLVQVRLRADGRLVADIPLSAAAGRPQARLVEPQDPGAA